MYGRVDEGTVEVDFIYEPPQEGTDETLQLLRNEGRPYHQPHLHLEG